MKKIDLILKTIKELATSEGITTSELSNHLNMERSNVSKILNELVILGEIHKNNSRPVKYFLSNPDIISLNSISGLDRLAYLYPSLNESIKLAKTSIIYPPNGMNSIILGDTGVGKSMLAKLMHEYAVSMFPEKNIPFVYFNCSDYANNPQLLSAQLFGVKKGTFTGADEDRSGLIEEANGGMLFLDEIHNLPSQGQEMLFLYMDSGYFKRFGDASKKINSSTHIICATNMNINEHLLNTFLRRIPVKIKLPNLNERSLDERLTLIEYFFREESQKLDKPLYVSYNTMLCLLSYNCPFNIGQLKNDISLLVANAYSNYFINNKKLIRINSPDLTSELRAKINTPIPEKRELLDSLNCNDGYFVYDKNTQILNYSFARQKQKIFNSYQSLVEVLTEFLSTKDRESFQLSNDFNNYFSTIIDNSINYTYNFSLNTFEEIINKMVNYDNSLKEAFLDDIFRRSFIIHFDLIYERMTFFKKHTTDLKDKLKIIDENLYKTASKYQSILEDCLNLYFAPCESTFIVMMVLHLKRII